MKILCRLCLLLSVLVGCAPPQSSEPYIWLEQIDSPEVLDWVKDRSEESVEVLSEAPDYQGIFQSCLSLRQNNTRLPRFKRYGQYLYNHHKDAQHPRGVWRRIALTDFVSGEDEWETLLDMQQLAEKTGKKWTFKRATPLFPDCRLFMLALSEGGSDTAIQREFDIESKSFVAGGFELAAAKSKVTYLDKDHLVVGTWMGEGSLTKSGYPRTLKLWVRGQSLARSDTLLVVPPRHVEVSSRLMRHQGREVLIMYDNDGYFSKQKYLYRDGSRWPLKLPHDSSLRGLFGSYLIVGLQTQWSVDGQMFGSGDIVAVDLETLLAGRPKVVSVVKNEKGMSNISIHVLKDSLVGSVAVDVKRKLFSINYDAASQTFVMSDLPSPQKAHNVSVEGVSTDANSFFVRAQGFLVPESLYYYESPTSQPKLIRSRKSVFDAENLVVNQYFVRSKDGTRVPYFVVHHKNMVADGSRPTLLYGYGGFGSSMWPRYSPDMGACWLSRGGVYVLANIRGGGEYGPRWHHDALKTKRMKCYEDFIAVAEDLIARKITSAKHLGISGTSNGGLLVGASMVLRPDLFAAVVCRVPLLDMKRYHRLLAGHSWIAEYGDPDDTKMWQVIRQYSPFHNVQKDIAYPPILLMSSTRDDRVHPGHARKMAARLRDFGNTVYYFEQTEGGHRGGVSPRQMATNDALIYTFLWTHLK